MTRESFHSSIVNYLAKRAALPADWSCASTDNLFDLGVLESFDLPNLVLHIERTLGRDADLMSQRVEVFYTLDSMYEAFVTPVEVGCAP
jgi:hypothetical protein